MDKHFDHYKSFVDLKTFGGITQNREKTNEKRKKVKIKKSHFVNLLCKLRLKKSCIEVGPACTVQTKEI